MREPVVDERVEQTWQPADVAERIGVEHVGLGSDFDGAPIPRAMADVGGLPRLLDALVDDGFSHQEVAQIAWWNWRRVLGASWSA